MKIITQNEAKQLSLITYFTGQECIHGHVSERYTSNKRCIICARLSEKKNPEKRRESLKRYKNNRSLEQRKRDNQCNKRWAEKNRDKLRENWRRQSTKLSKRIAKNLRMRLNRAIKQNNRAGSAVRDLGCSINNFKLYIEGKFCDDMTWDNWGRVWQLDHIQPLKNFDLSNHEQIKEVCHYSNLQPLLIEDHIAKTLAEKIILSATVY